ncbi:phosphonoacetaldehyde reductase [Kitasatospora sp. NPDC101157]|uniref:phosphonoacetaldehyde reductase n=1 Tax=Kitasatospora sp. NPDC101157 TaxID=3364098 RepID=UPI003824EB68
MTAAAQPVVDARRPTELHVGRGAVGRLGGLLDGHRARRVLVVATPRALHAVGVHTLLEDTQWLPFSAFTPNPRIEDVLTGCRLRENWQPDLVLGIGGGSAMDVAKAVRLLPADRDGALSALRGEADPTAVLPPPLVLVPTTAGSGSEATAFATVYADGRKHSLDHASVRATAAIVDPELTESCPPVVTTSCAFDALSHAIESFWSRRSTDASREPALRALELLLPAVSEDLRRPSADTRELLSRGALLAGQAIDITRTTAAHAFAYELTIRHGVPHGVACLLNLCWLFDHNLERADAPDDPRSPFPVLARLLGTDLASGAEVFSGLLQRHGWSSRLRDYGVTETDLDGLVRAGIGAGARARNNPVDLEPGTVREALARLL